MPKPYRSVADMPAKMRDCCERIVAKQSQEQIARTLNITPETVRMHLARARQRTGTHNRPDLIAWCKRGGNVRSVCSPTLDIQVNVRSIDGRMVTVQAGSCIQTLSRDWPDMILVAASKIRENRHRAAGLKTDAQHRRDRDRPDGPATQPTGT